MIKFAEINIAYKKSYFSRILYFNENDNIKEDIEYEVDDLISSISRLKLTPKYFIKKILYKKRYSINVTIYSIFNADDLNDNSCKERLEKFKSEEFCRDNEDLVSFIMEIYSNKSFYKRLLAFGNLEYYWSFRRELTDYNLGEFYKIGDIVLIDHYKDPFIITWVNNDISRYNFTNIYDVICIKNTNLQFSAEDGCHHNNISKVIGHDFELAKSMIRNNVAGYTQEYIDEIMAIKE